MAAKNHALLRLILYELKVGLEPFPLIGGEATVVIPGRPVGAGIGGSSRAKHVVHHYDMEVTPVEGIVGRTEVLKETGGRIEVSTCLGVMIVIADALEERQIPASDLDIGHGIPHSFPGVRAVKGDVT